MSAESTGEAQNGHRSGSPGVPGVADLGAFRGRTERSGPPVLPPGWRPDRDQAEPVRSTTSVVPVARPTLAPPGAMVVGATGREVRPVADPSGSEVPAGADGQTRVLRRIRPWSVWKMTLAFQVCMVAVTATAGAILWAVAVAMGALDNVEGFVEDLGFENFTFHGGAMLRAFVVGGLLVAFASALLASVLAVMFNLLSDLTGGLEAETAPATRRRARRRRARDVDVPVAAEPSHRGAVAAPVDPVVPAVSVAGGRARTPDIDLTDDPDVVGDGGAGGEVDHIQLAIDDLLRDEPPAGPAA